MKGSIIAFDPCPHCENHDMCSKCELTFRRSGVIANPCEWISVQERLPESGVHCLLACKVTCYNGATYTYVCDGFHVERWKEQERNNGSGDQAIEYNEEDDEYYLIEGWYEVIKNWDEYNSIVIDDTVTHWMPLPEAPKGGE